MGPDGQLLGPILSANGEPLNETAAQHYVAFAAQYAAQMAGASKLFVELVSRKLARAA